MEEPYLAPLSALQHLLFCERQFALIHIEGIWAENARTVEGKQLHEQVHQETSGARGELRIARSLALRSDRLGLVGVADVVEFHPVDKSDHLAAAVLPGVKGTWRPLPVEYKRGRPKPNRCDEVQVCAQALCLEEMLKCAVPRGALFYGKTRRRKDVIFDHQIRQLTEGAARRVHELIQAGITPKASPTRACKQCSLVHLCLPEISGRRKVARYLRDMLKQEDE